MKKYLFRLFIVFAAILIVIVVDTVFNHTTITNMVLFYLSVAVVLVGAVLAAYWAIQLEKEFKEKE
jgi:predicted membrane channel-forming protein YqfA (hemolysin III family)